MSYYKSLNILEYSTGSGFKSSVWGGVLVMGCALMGGVLMGGVLIKLGVDGWWVMGGDGLSNQG